MDSERNSFPAHVEESIRSVAEIRADHDRQASLHQRGISRLTDQLGKASSVAIICSVIVLWMGVNLALPHLRMAAFDPPPFTYLEGIVSPAALIMTLLILTSQRHETQLSEHRAQLTLELAIVSDLKVAKLIELVDHQRRDNPLLEDRVDHEAVAMARPANPQVVLDAIRETRSDPSAEGKADPT